MVILKVLKKYIELSDAGKSPRHFYNFVITILELAERNALITGDRLNMGQMTRKYDTTRSRLLDTWKMCNERGFLEAVNESDFGRYVIRLGPVFKEYFAAIMLETNEFPGDEFVKSLFKQFFEATRDTFAGELQKVINKTVQISFKEENPDIWKFLNEDQKTIIEVYETYAKKLELDEFGIFEKITKTYDKNEILEAIYTIYGMSRESNYLTKYGLKALDNHLSLKHAEAELNASKKK